MTHEQRHLGGKSADGNGPDDHPDPVVSAVECRTWSPPHRRIPEHRFQIPGKVIAAGVPDRLDFPVFLLDISAVSGDISIRPKTAGTGDEISRSGCALRRNPKRPLVRGPRSEQPSLQAVDPVGNPSKPAAGASHARRGAGSAGGHWTATVGHRRSSSATVEQRGGIDE